MGSGAASVGDGAALYEDLIGYLPHYRRAAFDPLSGWSFPGRARATAAVLRSDIVGFTRLTDRMVQGGGIAGAEELAGVLNGVINRMAEIVADHGGELVDWEGDAGTFVWFPREGLQLDEAVALAAQAADEVHREARSWRIDGAAIQFRSAIGCGALAHFEIGGRDGQWHAALAGEALSGVWLAGDLAEAGDIVLSPAATARAGGWFQLAARDGGAARVIEIARAATPPQGPPLTGEVPLLALRRAMPPVVLAGARAAAAWPGEFRLVTVAYLQLRHPDGVGDDDMLAILHTAAQQVQACLARFEGQIYLIAPEDGGVTFITLFGLPPWPHEDDAARAVKSALTLRREWAAAGHTSAAGVATGRVFCGAFQTTTGRAVLALVGPPMNLAARLMQLDAGAVCDEATLHAGRQAGRIAARPLPPRPIKGKAEPVTPYAAYDVLDADEPARDGEAPPILGRAREIATLTEALARTRDGVGGVVVIEGEAGIGKTTLLNRAAALARAAGMLVLSGAGDSTDPATPYLAWRRVFLTLIGESDLTLGPEPARAAPTLALQRFAAAAPLMRDMLGLDARDNAETGRLSGQARADALARLLRDLLIAAARQTPILLAIEDMHWLDATSLKLFVDLAAAKPPLLLVGATRGPETHPAVQRALAPVEDIACLRPQPLSAEETGDLVARTLGAPVADDPLARMFRDRTGGNPLFVEELSRMAFANQLLRIDGAVQARASVSAAKAELDRILERQGLPGTIEGVIRRRLDDLAPPSLSVLRAASVVGQSFERSLCAAGAPALPPLEIERALDALIGLGVVAPSPRTPGEYVFRHEVLRDVVYNAMSFAERRQLHDAIGLYIEQRPQTEDVSALLGRHFLQAHRVGKAIRYLTRAGEVAIRRYANAEAVELLSRAQELAQASGEGGASDGVSRAERAHLLLLLGRACLGLSRYAECRAHSEAGLRLAGFRAPAKAAGVALGLLGETGRLVRYRLRPARGAPESERVGLREAVLAYEALAETYFYSGDGLRTLHAAMCTLNLSERLGPSAELARGCATMTGISGFFRLRKTSDHYASRALAILRQLDSPAAETWVFTLLGLSRLGEGQWAASRAYLARVVAAAETTGDRRRWRDGIENSAIIEACRGEWASALQGLSAMYAAAEEDKDQRYVVMACRERAYCNLHLGDLDAVARDLARIRQELARGLTAEEPATRLDLHAFAATLALARGQKTEAAREAEAALAAMREVVGKSAVTNTYWSMLLIARAFANLAREAPGDAALRKALNAARRALAAQARSYPIAAPAAAIVEGYAARLLGREGAATRGFRRAAARAERLGMRYEGALARAALEAGATPGLAFFAQGSAADAR